MTNSTNFSTPNIVRTFLSIVSVHEYVKHTPTPAIVAKSVNSLTGVSLCIMVTNHTGHGEFGYYNVIQVTVDVNLPPIIGPHVQVITLGDFPGDLSFFNDPIFGAAMFDVFNTSFSSTPPSIVVSAGTGIQSLNGCPREVAALSIRTNRLTSLAGAPTKCTGAFDVSFNPIKTLDGLHLESDCFSLNIVETDIPDVSQIAKHVPGAKFVQIDVGRAGLPAVLQILNFDEMKMDAEIANWTRQLSLKCSPSTDGPGPLALTRLLRDILRSSTTCRMARLRFQRGIQELRDIPGDQYEK